MKEEKRGIQRIVGVINGISKVKNNNNNDKVKYLAVIILFFIYV
jgi:hypothetical protein